jgi:hypothetical protein
MDLMGTGLDKLIQRRRSRRDTDLVRIHFNTTWLVHLGGRQVGDTPR